MTSMHTPQWDAVCIDTGTIREKGGEALQQVSLLEQKALSAL